MEREITTPTDIARPDGTLSRDAVGWARHPLFRPHPHRRTKGAFAWNYWCVTGRSGTAMVLFADVGFAGVVLLSFLDHATGAQSERVHVHPLGLQGSVPPMPRGDLAIDVPRLRLELRERGEELFVMGHARPLLGPPLSVDLVIDRPLAHETLNVLVPFSDDAFQLTSKQQGLRARGRVRVGETTHVFGEETDAFACLDYGRGRRPRGIHWNWGFCSGTSGARTVGMNLGGRWTDGTGVTENGFVVDGRLHKIHDDVAFERDLAEPMRPWTVRALTGGRVELRFVPEHRRVVRVPLGPVGVELWQMLGRWSGKLVDDAGEVVVLDGLFGLAEELKARW